MYWTNGFEEQVRPRLKGESHIVRYADDFICTFALEEDAKRFQEVLVKRLGRYSLELAQDKTKLIRFGRFATRDSQRAGEGRRALLISWGSIITVVNHDRVSSS